MKKILFSILLAGLMLPLLSQGIHNLVIFTEEGERFQVVLNGVLQNAEPETNVMIRDLIAPSYKVKIIFEDQIPDLDKTIYFLEGSSQDTYSIKPNRKGEYVMRPQNSVPLEQAPPPPPNQVVHVYSTTPPPPSSVTVVETTTHHDQVPGTSVNVNANMSGMNINMNINDAHVSSSSTTTTTTTHTSGTVVEQVYVLPGYDGYYGCPYPMSDADFQMAKRSIESKSFSDSKVTMAKQIINSNCMLTSQIYQIMELFSFEDDRLEIAKYAYGSTLDVGNYYRVNDAFTFESSIEELDEYIRSYHR
jgi:hypothetical protein